MIFAPWVPHRPNRLWNKASWMWRCCSSLWMWIDTTMCVWNHATAGAHLSADRPLASKPFIRPKDLDGQALILPDRDAVRSLVVSWLGDWANAVTVAATANFLSNATVLVHAGVGIIIGIDIPTHDAHLRFIPLRPKLENSTLIAWKKGRPASPRSKRLRRFSPSRLMIEGTNRRCH